MYRLMLFAARRPWQVVALLLLVTLAAASQLRHLHLHISAEGMMLEGDPARSAYDAARATFGAGEATLIFLRDGQLLTEEPLAAIDAVVKRIEALPEVAGVTSLFSVANIRSVDGEISAAPYLATLPEDPEGAAALLKAALRNPLVADTLISRDGSAMALAVEFAQGADSEAAVPKIDALIAPLGERLERVFQIGSPVITRAVSEKIKDDQSRILPLSLGVLIVALALAMRRLSGALVPLLTALVSVVWTLAFMAVMEIPINVMTSIIPALLVIVGSTEDVHLLSEYYGGLDRPASPSRALVRMARAMGMAILLTFATTGIGFLSIATNPIAILQQFGLIAALGLAFNFVATTLLVPAWLTLFTGRPRAANVRGGDGLFARAALAMLRGVRAHPRLLTTVVVLLCAASVAGATRITLNNDPLDYFAADDPVRQEIGELQGRLAGMQSFSIVLDADIEGTFLKVRYLRELEKLQGFLAETGLFDKSLSFADTLALVNAVMEEDNFGRLRLPDEDAVAQEYMNFLKHRDVAAYVSPDYSEARIVVRHSISSSRGLKAALERVQGYLDEGLAPGLHATITGEAILTQRAADHMAIGQAISLLLMVVVIWVVVSALFVNLKAGLLAVIPNLIPITILFGVMGLFAIPLDTSTAMVAAIALGICVDDTMHFMVRYHHHSQHHGEPGHALEETVREEAAPIFTTSLALAAGFAVLAVSEFPPVVHFGLLSALVMISALLATFLVTPVLLSRVHLVSLWGMMGLQLRTRVRDHCALFTGMRPWQIKKLILSAEVRELAEGQRIITQGEPGEEMFVLLDGEAEVWVTNDDHARHSIATLTSGDVLGEIALIAKTPRVANVTALARTQVLVLRWESVVRMGRLYPFLAARLFLNLSTILGARLASTTNSSTYLQDRSSGAFSAAFLRKLMELELLRARRHGDPVACLVLEMTAPAHDRKEGEGLNADMRRLRDDIIPMLRSADILARLDHRRFALLMPKTDARGAENLAQRLLERIGHDTPDTPPTVTISAREIGKELELEHVLELYFGDE